MSDSYVSAELRRFVRERAKDRCEYCWFPESAGFFVHEIDHIVAEKHGGPTIAENLGLSCVVCNKHKGSDLTSIDPETGAIVPLFHPRRDVWSLHFRWNGPTIDPLTTVGRVTVRLLQLNHPRRLEERRSLILAGVIVTS